MSNNVFGPTVFADSPGMPFLPLTKIATQSRCGLVVRPAYSALRFVIVSVLLSGVVSSSLAVEAESGEAQEAQLEEVKGQIQHLKSDLNESESRRRKLMAELQVTETNIGLSMRRLREIKAQLEGKEERLAALGLENRHNQQALELQRSALIRQIRAAYAMGRQERLKILLNQQDPELVSRMLVYYDYFNRARFQRMSQIHEIVLALKQSAAKLEAERLRLVELNAQELDEQRRLSESRLHRQQLVTSLGEDISSKTQRLRILEKDALRLQRLVEQLQDAQTLQPLDEAEQQSFNSLKGQLSWPTKGRLAAGFGQSKGGNLKWDGVMISAPEGDEVRAVHRGRIAFSDWLRGFGLLVIVDHGDGYMTLYGHNQSLFKEIGEWVEAGEALALVGNSGGREQSGVYFGIRVRGKPVNPKRWCQRIKGGRVGWSPGIDEGSSGLSAALLQLPRLEISDRSDRSRVYNA